MGEVPAPTAPLELIGMTKGQAGDPSSPGLTLSFRLRMPVDAPSPSLNPFPDDVDDPPARPVATRGPVRPLTDQELQALIDAQSITCAARVRRGLFRQLASARQAIEQFRIRRGWPL